MYRAITLVLVALCTCSIAKANEYCYDTYGSKISKVNAELGDLLARQQDLDNKISELFKEINDLAISMAQESTKTPIDLEKIKSIGDSISRKGRLKSEYEASAYANTQKIYNLKHVIPSDLAGELRGCVEASAPINKLVNITIQALAILSTGGASLALPEKTLYVDMSAVLNGYPLGGPQSVVNQARESALNALGIGGENNDIGRIIRDPGSVIRSCFGLC